MYYYVIKIIHKIRQITGDDNKSKGFGFVSYEDSVHAEAACDDLNGKDIEGKPIYVGRAQKKAERQAELKKKFEALKMERMTRYQGKQSDIYLHCLGLRITIAQHYLASFSIAQHFDKT